MPGIVGFSCAGMDSKKCRSVLMDMQSMITYFDFQKKDHFFLDPSICCTRSSVGGDQNETQPYHKEGIYLWLDGEFYNQCEQSIRTDHKREMPDIEMLYLLYVQNEDFRFLSEIDGQFSAVIYDSLKKKLHIFSDRLGIKQLYWNLNNGCFAWSSEVKAFLQLPGFEPIIDSQAVKEFFEVGYLLELRTWFEGVSLIPSGTVITWDIDASAMSSFRYWWWDRIAPVNQQISEDEAIDELGRLFKKAVAKRSDGHLNVGVSLSGGLDSRAILAAIPPKEYPIQTLTYGQKKSPDVELAKIVAEVNAHDHHIVDLNATNWVAGRLENIWRTDGQFSFYHMHSLISYERAANLFAVNLDGNGSPVIGGYYMNPQKEQPITKTIAAAHIQASGYMPCSPDIIGSLDDYQGLSRTEYFLMQNRQRRLLNEGIRQGSNYLRHRMPFMDNELVEFTYSLPDRMRENGNLFFKMLVRNYPEYFMHIAEQHSGMPISKPRIMHKMNDLMTTMKNKMIRKANIGKYPSYNQFCNYPEWIKCDPAKAIVEKMLFNKKALFREFLPENMAVENWQRHLQGKDSAQKICLQLTFEIWLQQVYNRTDIFEIE